MHARAVLKLEMVPVDVRDQAALEAGRPGVSDLLNEFLEIHHYTLGAKAARMRVSHSSAHLTASFEN